MNSVQKEGIMMGLKIGRDLATSAYVRLTWKPQEILPGSSIEAARDNCIAMEIAMNILAKIEPVDNGA